MKVQKRTTNIKIMKLMNKIRFFLVIYPLLLTLNLFTSQSFYLIYHSFYKKLLLDNE